MIGWNWCRASMSSTESALGSRETACKSARIAQEWSLHNYGKHSFVAELGQDLLGLLDPQAGERILDLGCGDGALTQKLLPSAPR